MKNEARHRMARKEAGLTSCSACNDSGHVTTYHGAGRIGCRTESRRCAACTCFCGEFANFANGLCANCANKPEGENFLAAMKDLFGSGLC